jgi:hypothetical protein
MNVLGMWFLLCSHIAKNHHLQARRHFIHRGRVSGRRRFDGWCWRGCNSILLSLQFLDLGLQVIHPFDQQLVRIVGCRLLRNALRTGKP